MAASSKLLSTKEASAPGRTKRVLPSRPFLLCCSRGEWGLQALGFSFACVRIHLHIHMRAVSFGGVNVEVNMEGHSSEAIHLRPEAIHQTVSLIGLDLTKKAGPAAH